VKTLPDYLRSNLDIISVGLNPSINSVRAGYYFATKQNRFWRALNVSGLVGETLEPGIDSMEAMFDRYAIGFTDVVKRPTPGLSSLRAADFRQWAPELSSRLNRYRPRIAWFHGKITFEKYLRYGEESVRDVMWGRQRRGIGDIIVFVTPNPSPANAIFSLADITAWYRKLAVLRRRLHPR